MHTKTLYIIVLAALSLAGCSKNSADTPPPLSNATYFPINSGSSWVYNDLIVNGVTNVITNTMVGGSAVINGKTYYAVLSSSPTKGTFTEYYYSGTHDYAIRATNAAAGITLELQAGNDSLAVGATWTTSPTDNGMVSGLPAQTVNTIKEKNITKIFNGNTFNNVIHTQVDLQYNFGTGFQSVATYDIYLAQGIGLIQLDTSISGTLTESETLTSFTIK